MLAVVFPEPTGQAAPAKILSTGPHTSHTIPTTDTTSSAHLYKYDAVAPLPAIDITRTLLAKLCGRVDDAPFNARIIAFSRRMDPFVHLVAIVFVPASVSLFFVSSMALRSTMSVVTFVTGVTIFAYIAVSLSWDLLRLVLCTFEFWFLFFITAANDVLWNLLFHDVRMVGFIATGLNFAISLCFDANVYTRRFVTRVLVLGSPELLLGLILTALHYPPDLHYTAYTLFGVTTIDTVDLLVNGNLIIAYFTATRVMRSQHLVFSTDPIRSIQCDIYHPVCQLVPHAQPLVAEEDGDPATTVAPAHSTTIQRLQFIVPSSAVASAGIDVTDLLWPRLARFATPVGPFLNALGVCSHLTGALGSY